MTLKTTKIPIYIASFSAMLQAYLSKNTFTFDKPLDPLQIRPDWRHVLNKEEREALNQSSISQSLKGNAVTPATFWMALKMIEKYRRTPGTSIKLLPRIRFVYFKKIMETLLSVKTQTKPKENWRWEYCSLQINGDYNTGGLEEKSRNSQRSQLVLECGLNVYWQGVRLGRKGYSQLISCIWRIHS